jgi:transcriptional regulator
MYLPAQFKAKHEAHALDIIRAYPFGNLISNDDEGFPFLTHLPLHLEMRGDQLVLLGHVAKANPHGQYLRARPRVLVTFLGPHAYMSPKVYPDLARVPTWSYLAVHAKAEVVLLDDEQAKDQLLKLLIADHESSYAQQWRDLDASYQSKMLSGITAFELHVTALECKLKLNQHRPESHAAMYQAYAQGTPDEQALAQWMITLGLVKPQA